jgi:peroxiredoxin Q/BCP
MIKIKTKAPAFSMPDQDGKTHKLSDYLGDWVLLYFYPKDDTSGCTKEACAIRDELPNFKKLKCKVLGVSTDSVESHKKFADKYGLPFTLLSDEDKKVVEKYGVWQEKSMYGRKYMGIARSSFMIDPKGRIAKIYQKVNPETHAEEVLQDLKDFYHAGKK